MARTVNLYIAMSLDGYIAKNDDNIDFLSAVDTPGEDYGYAEFSSTIDTVIWGRRTYDKVLTLPQGPFYQDKKIYVVSKTRTGEAGNVTFHPDLLTLVNDLKTKEGKNLYCDGGAEIVFELLKHGLIDRIIVSVIPYLLGDGIRLFKAGFPEQKLKFKKSCSFPSGLVQLWYDVLKVTD